MNLSKLWTDLSKIPVNNIGQITEPFIHFSAGTYIEDVWLWFEEQDDNFKVVEQLQPREKIVVCPYHG